MGLETALVVGLGGAGAGLSFAQAKAQNKAINNSIASSNAATTQQIIQLSRAAANERRQNESRLRDVLGRLRTGSAERGITGAGSAQLLQTQAVYDAAYNRAATDYNEGANASRLYSENYARSKSLQASKRNPLLAAIQGGLQGASMGSSISSLFAPAATVGATASTAINPTSNALDAAGMPATTPIGTPQLTGLA